MKSNFGGTFKEYYDGDPDRIPLFNLPCLIVDQTTDTTVQAAFGQDDVTDRIVIKVVYNKADDYDGTDINPMNLTSRKIRDIIGRLDKDKPEYAEGTVKHLLRNALFEGVTILAEEISVDYGVTPRDGLEEEFATLTAEGHVTFDMTRSVNTEH